MISIHSYFMAKFYDAVMSKTEQRCLRDWRSRLLAGAAGEVLEIGAGTGVNLAHYPKAVNQLLLCEPEANMRKQLKRRVQAAGRSGVRIAGHPAGQIDLPDESLDGVVSTLVLCSVPDPTGSLREIHRLLRPGGSFFFIEHVGAKNDRTLLAWQRFCEPLWRFCCGNCHLTRDTEDAIGRAGLSIPQVERTSMLGVPSVVRPVIVGVAIKPGVSA